MAAPVTTYPITITIRDGHGRLRTVRLPGRTITAANFDQVMAYAQSLVNNLVSFTNGSLERWTFGREIVTRHTLETPDPDSSHDNMLLVHCRGNTTGRLWSFRLPTFDFTKGRYAAPPAANTLIITGPGASTTTQVVRTKLQEEVRCPWNPNETITVTGMEIVD